MSKILIIDDEESIREVLSAVIEANGHEADTSPDGNDALERISAEEYDLVLCDIRMDPMDGMEVLRRALRIKPDLRVIMLTAFGSVSSAKEAMKVGAFDYMTKPWKLDELLLNIERGLSNEARSTEKVDRAGADAPEEWEFEPWAESVKQIAADDAICLIHSTSRRIEIAKLIHEQSARKSGPFEVLSCGALPEPILELEMMGCAKGAVQAVPGGAASVFERAAGGTVVLDEIEWMPHSLQEQLVKILKEGAFERIGGMEDILLHAGIIAATHQEPQALAESSRAIPELFGLFGDRILSAE